MSFGARCAWSRESAGDQVGKLVPRKPGRPKGSRNRRTVLGSEHLSSLTPKAKRRLAEIVQKGEPELAMKAAELILAYCYGRPVQAGEISGPDGGPIEGGALGDRDDIELARRVAFTLSQGQRALDGGATLAREPRRRRARVL